MRLVRLLLAVPILGACSFQPVAGLTEPDADGSHIMTDGRLPPPVDGTLAMLDAFVAPDGAMPFVPLHVPPGARYSGTTDFVLTTAVDTSALSIGGSTTMPAGVTFDMWPQLDGPALAVLHVKSLTLPFGVTVGVTGARAFVVIASGDITIGGTLDAGAHRDVPGPAGSPPDLGAGKGLPGQSVGTYPDSGGSGAGFGGSGGAGGRGGLSSCTSNAPQIAAGGSYGDASLSALLGGSGGGTAVATSCGNTPAGAGGGAVQLSSASRVAITGGINAGGGGGGGGRAYDTQPGHCDMSAGSGAGSGGAIELQAPLIQITGILAANGGAGGSAGGDPNGDDMVPTAHGIAGQDGQLATNAAIAGTDVGTWSAAGGAGGVRSAAAATGGGSDECAGNGGGGGGSVGRIVLARPSGGTVQLGGSDTPMATPIVY